MPDKFPRIACPPVACIFGSDDPPTLRRGLRKHAAEVFGTEHDRIALDEHEQLERRISRIVTRIQRRQVVGRNELAGHAKALPRTRAPGG